jgi:hypothetical protein
MLKKHDFGAEATSDTGGVERFRPITGSGVMPKVEVVASKEVGCCDE